jgi:hypothetical protein
VKIFKKYSDFVKWLHITSKIIIGALFSNTNTKRHSDCCVPFWLISDNNQIVNNIPQSSSENAFERGLEVLVKQ